MSLSAKQDSNMTARNQNPSAVASLIDAAKVERIVDYLFEKSEKSNVLAIHPTRPLVAYLINIQRTPKISKAWSSGNDSVPSPSSSSINGQLGNSSSSEKNKTVSIRIIDYQTHSRCLAKGIYHARPTDCVFTINSLLCSQSQDVLIKMAVVDRLANVYLYDLAYHNSGLIATRVAVIMSPAHELSPYEYINLVWCPFVPCEDFDDGDGGLRLALSTNSRIEIFAVDRLQGRTGELQRSELKGAYKCIHDAHRSNIVSLSISPDCSTISAAAMDNRVTFFSSDIDDGGQRCLHNWEATMTDSPISKLFFLDDYPKLLEDSTMKFWGAAFIGTRSGQMLLVDLRTWSVYQKMHLNPDPTGPKNFDYRIELTSRNIVAIDGNQCYIVQIDHDYARLSSQSLNTSEVGGNHHEDASTLDSGQNDLMNGNIFNYLLSATNSSRSNQKPTAKKHGTSNSASGAASGLPKIVRATKLGLYNPIYSFVPKHKSNDELELFTISAYSLDRFKISLSALEAKSKMKAEPPVAAPITHPPAMPSPQLFSAQADPNVTPTKTLAFPAQVPSKVESTPASGTISVDVNQMDRMVEALFNKLNVSFSQGLDEFLTEIKCEVNDLKSKLSGLSRDVSKLQQQVHDIRQK